MPEPGSSGGFNRYRYTRNNPLKFTDPSGHNCVGAFGLNISECIGKALKQLTEPIVEPVEDILEITDVVDRETATIIPELMNPDLYIEGVSGRFGGAKGGFEKVYDFSTKEVGFFSYGGGQFGSDVIGVDAGAYFGVGNKGSLKDVSLELAYSDAFYAAGGSGNLPFDLVSLGGDFSVSGDEPFDFQNNHLATPDFQAAKTVTFGGGIGYSNNPLPGNGHIAATNYDYLGGEQFGTSTKMLDYIWRNEPFDKALFLTSLALANDLSQ